MSLQYRNGDPSSVVKPVSTLKLNAPLPSNKHNKRINYHPSDNEEDDEDDNIERQKKKKESCCTWTKSRDILWTICFLGVTGIAILIGYEIYMISGTVNEILDNVNGSVKLFVAQKQTPWFDAVDNAAAVIQTVKPQTIAETMGHVDSVTAQAAALNISQTVGSTNDVLNMVSLMLAAIRKARGLTSQFSIPLDF
jgi:hypothetical protein